MSEDKRISNAKLGALVLAGLLFLVFSLYMIGKNQNIFGSSIIVIAEVEEVNGLLPGNNVRFKGMDVGTVSGIDMITDSTIQVKMLIHKSMVPFILKNAKTTINSDGLMGNKIIQIHPMDGPSAPIEVGDILYPLEQLDTDRLMEQLGSSGDALELTLQNLAEITGKLNQSEALWSLLADPALSQEIKSTLVEFKKAGNQAAQLAREGKEMIAEFRGGEGIMNTLFLDTLESQKLENSLTQLQNAATEARNLLNQLNQVVADIESEKGTAGMLISDSVVKSQIERTLENVEKSTANFNENMEALKSNFLFRRYFKKKEKEAGDQN